MPGSRRTLVIARTDAVAVEGFDRAVERALAYREAGADILFVEAPKAREDLAAHRGSASAPQCRCIANMVEGGKTPPLSAAELEAIGFALVIFPGGIVRAIAKTMQDYFASLAAHGTTEPFRARMFDFQQAQRTDRNPGADCRAARPTRRRRRQSRGGRGERLDPVTLAVLNGRLVQIADEMDATLYRSAFNPIIAEAHDASHGLYDAETGATLGAGNSQACRSSSARWRSPCNAVIDKAGARRRPRGGDAYSFNDPYDGGTHLNDIRLVRPLLRNGRVFCLARVGRALARCRRQRAGQLQRRGHGDAFRKALRVPAGEADPRRRPRSRTSSIFSLPTRACRNRTGATSTARSTRSISASRRLEALLDEYGDDTVAAALAQLSRAGRGADARQHRGAAGRHL